MLDFGVPSAKWSFFMCILITTLYETRRFLAGLREPRLSHFLDHDHRPPSFRGERGSTYIEPSEFSTTSQDRTRFPAACAFQLWPSILSFPSAAELRQCRSITAICFYVETQRRVNSNISDFALLFSSLWQSELLWGMFLYCIIGCNFPHGFSLTM